MDEKIAKRIIEVREELIFRNEPQLKDIDKQILSLVHKKERIVRNIEKTVIGIIIDEIQE